MKKKLDIKKLILLNLPYVFAFYFVNKLATVFRPQIARTSWTPQR